MLDELPSEDLRVGLVKTALMSVGSRQLGIQPRNPLTPIEK